MRGMRPGCALIIGAPEIREIFAWAQLEEAQTTYTVAGKGQAKPAAELLIRGPRD